MQLAAVQDNVIHMPSPLALVKLAADSIRATTPCCVLWVFIVPSSFVTTEHHFLLKDHQMYKMCILQQDCNGLQHGLCILHRSLVHLYDRIAEQIMSRTQHRASYQCKAHVYSWGMQTSMHPDNLGEQLQGMLRSA